MQMFWSRPRMLLRERRRRKHRWQSVADMLLIIYIKRSGNPTPTKAGRFDCAHRIVRDRLREDSRLKIQIVATMLPRNGGGSRVFRESAAGGVSSSHDRAMSAYTRLGTKRAREQQSGNVVVRRRVDQALIETAKIKRKNQAALLADCDT